ncbi:MAG: hypothetical protein FWE88_04265 [Phycisphaerae bacterium]|nr:hypothetical protein [Phycisphaerae bacterium]
MVRHVLILAAVVSLVTAFHADAQVPPVERTQTELVRFVDLKGASTRTPMLKVVRLSNNQAADLSLDVSNRDLEDLKDLRNGDYVTIDIARREGKFVVVAAEPYELRPGEEEENVYLYYDLDERKINNRAAAVLRVTKLGKNFEFVLPSTIQQGRAIPRDEFKTLIEDLTDGDSIVITATPAKPPVVKTLTRYEPPEVGTFIKQTEIVDGKNRLPALLIADATNIEHTIAMHPTKRAQIIARIKGIKDESTKLYIRTVTDDKGFWLSDVRLAPKDAKPTVLKIPAAKKDADKKDADKDKDKAKDKDDDKVKGKDKDSDDERDGGRTFGVEDDDEQDVKKDDKKDDSKPKTDGKK